MGRKLPIIIAIFAILAFLLGISIPVHAGVGASREVKLGKKVADKIATDLPETENLVWRAEINEMGSKLVAQCGRQDIEYHFKIIRIGDEMNAFALPGGFIYITEPLWKVMSHDERAAIIGHEIAHVSERHWAKRYDRDLKKTVGMVLASVLLAPSAGVMRTVRTADSLMGMSYSRKDEREADALGLDYMTEAGYQPYAFVTALEKLNSLSGDYARDLKFLSTHPLTRDRIKWGTEQMQTEGIERPVYASHKSIEPTTIAESEKPLVIIDGLTITGDYVDKGAVQGVIDILAIEMARTGQIYTDPAQMPEGDHPTYHMRGEVSIVNMQVKDTVELKMHVEMVNESGEVVHMLAQDLTRSGDPGYPMVAPWVELGIYTRCVDRSLAGRTILEAMRIAAIKLAPRPHLLNAAKVVSVDEKAKTVTVDLGRRDLIAGMTLHLEKPFGDYYADEETGEIYGRELVPIADFDVVDVQSDTSVTKVTLANRAEWKDIAPGDRLEVK